MNRFGHLIILLLILTGIQAGAQELSLKYRFSYDTSLVKPQLKVKLSFKGNSSGKTVLQFPDRWASQQELYKGVTAFTVKTKDVIIDSNNSPLKRLLTHKPGQQLEIEYAIEQDWEGPLMHPKNYRAMVDKKYFQATGYALLIYPESDPSVMTELQLDWKNMPKDWSIGNSFHSGSREYKCKTMLGNFQNSVFVGGDFRLHSTTIGKETINMAIRGDWKFKDSAMLASVADIVTRERDFWNDHTQPYYFVSLFPFDGRGTLNGSSLHNSFFMGMTAEYPLDINVQYLLSHEYFHRWIGGNGKLVFAAGKEEEGYWFSEGFTDYYTYKFLSATGMISQKKYVDMINTRLAEYYLSPVRDKDNKTIGENFWKSRDYQMIPYRKGFTYALYIDWLIQSSTNKKFTLDNFIFDALKHCESGGKFNDVIFVELVRKFSGKDISVIHTNSISKGELIPLDSTTAFIINDSLVVRPQQMGAFDIGFDYDASSKARKLTGVKENSAAWQAGLRDGQTIKGWSFQFNDISKPAMITVIDESGQEKKVSYSPQSVEKFSVPQIMSR